MSGEVARRKGRTPKWRDPDRLDRIINAIEQGNFTVVAATANGIAENTLYNWLAQAQEEDAPPELVHFAERFFAARASAEMKAVDHLWVVGNGGALIKRRTGFTKSGEEFVEEEYTPPTAQPIMFLLERGMAGRWGRKQTLAFDPQTDQPGQAPARQAPSEGIETMARRLAYHMAVQRGEVTETIEGEVVDD